MYPVFLCFNLKSCIYRFLLDSRLIGELFQIYYNGFNAYGYKRLTAFFLVICRTKPIGSLLIVYVQYLKVYPVRIFSVQRLLISRIVL